MGYSDLLFHRLCFIIIKIYFWNHGMKTFRKRKLTFDLSVPAIEEIRAGSVFLLEL